MDLNRFTAEKLTAHVTRIVDALDVACYLVEGEKGACLLDTCPGEGNVRAFVETLTDRPLTVALTHAHMDHCGGAGFFDRVLLKKEELPILATHKGQAFRSDFFSAHHHLDLTPEDFAPVPEEVFEDFPDGMALDLGGVTVQLLPFPGHTPGTVCPFIPEDRVLIIGDACDDNVLLFDEYSSTVSEYRANLKKMIDRRGEYDRILGNHGCFEFTMELLENVLECCDRILAGTDARQPVHMLGEDLLSANALGEDELRLDGKPGNILYTPEKAR